MSEHFFPAPVPQPDKFGRVLKPDGSWDRILTDEEMKIHLADTAEKAATQRENARQSEENRIGQEAVAKSKEYTRESAFDYIRKELQETYDNLQKSADEAKKEPYLSFAIYIETNKGAKTMPIIKVDKMFENCVSLEKSNVKNIVETEIANALVAFGEERFCITGLRVNASITESDGNTFLGISTDKQYI